MYGTGLRCKVSDWDIKTNYPKKQDQLVNLRAELKKFADKFEEVVQSFDTIADLAHLRAELDTCKPQIIERLPDPESISIDMWSAHSNVALYGLAILKDNPVYFNKSTKRWEDMTSNTLKTKKSSIKKLQDFEKAHYPITFTNCDASFWMKFAAYLKAKKYAPNSRGKVVKDIKSLLNHALKYQEFDVNLAFKKEDVAPIEKQEVDKVALSLEQIKKLQDLDIADGLMNSRDWLLIACATGLRNSDFLRLTSDNIIMHNGNQHIEIATQKGKGKVVQIAVDTFDWLRPLLERRDWQFPPNMTVQKLNDNLKTIGGKLGVDGLTTHAGRHSFITNLLRRGIDSIVIAELTGHADLELIRSYAQLKKGDAAEIAAGRGEFKMSVA